MPDLPGGAGRPRRTSIRSWRTRPSRTYLRRFHDDEVSPVAAARPGDRRDRVQAGRRRAFREPRGARPGRPCLPGRQLQVPEVPHPHDRVAARQGRPGPPVRPGAGGLVPVPARAGRPGPRDHARGRSASWSRRAPIAEASRQDPAAFLGFSEVFGPRLPLEPVFSEAFTSALSSIREIGAYRTLGRWLDEGT